MVNATLLISTTIGYIIVHWLYYKLTGSFNINYMSGITQHHISLLCLVLFFNSFFQKEK